MKVNKRQIASNYTNAFIFLMIFSQFALSIINHTIALIVQLISFTILAIKHVDLSKIKTSAFFIWYFLFSVISLVSCYLSTGAINSNIFNMAQLIIVIFFADQVRYNSERSDQIYNSYIISCIIVGMWLIAASIRAGDARLGRSVSESLPIWIGSYSSLSFCMCIWLSTKNKGTNYEKWYLIASLCCFIILFFTGSRKYYLSIAGAILFYIVNQKKGKLRRVIIILLILVLFIYLIFNNPLLYNILGRRIDKLINYTSSSDILDDKSAYVRDMFARTGWEAVKQNIFFGHGMWTWNSVIGMGTHPHNNYIDLLFSLGLFGCLYYYIYLFRIWWMFWKIKTNKITKQFFIISLTLIFIMDYYQRSFSFDPVIIFLYFSYIEVRSCIKQDAITQKDDR